MAVQQTYIIKVWNGADTYFEAGRKRSNGDRTCDADFHRVGCKRVETCKKYIKNWREQVIEKGWQSLFRSLAAEDGRYEIIATPDGYHEEGVVASGMIIDL